MGDAKLQAKWILRYKDKLQRIPRQVLILFAKEKEKVYTVTGLSRLEYTIIFILWINCMYDAATTV